MTATSAPRRPDLPTGTVTFLFSDLEGSTRLTQELGTATYRQLLEEHNRILRDAFRRHGGVERGRGGRSLGRRGSLRGQATGETERKGTGKKEKA